MFFSLRWFLLKKMDCSNYDSMLKLIITLEIILLNFPFHIVNILITHFRLLSCLLDTNATGLVIPIVSIMLRLEKLEVASNEFPIKHLIEQITHVLSVTLTLIKKNLLQLSGPSKCFMSSLRNCSGRR